jgi:hypothetical protein
MIRGRNVGSPGNQILYYVQGSAISSPTERFVIIDMNISSLFDKIEKDVSVAVTGSPT